jgi:hypothetical protein
MKGRPTICTPELITSAEEYVAGGWREVGDKVPTIAGLAVEIGVHRETLRLWSSDESNRFFGIIRDLMAAQERALANGGLGGDFQPTIAKLMLSKHGYSDSVDHRSGDGSMTPKAALDLSKLSTDALEAIVKAADGQADD